MIKISTFTQHQKKYQNNPTSRSPGSTNSGALDEQQTADEEKSVSAIRRPSCCTSRVRALQSSHQRSQIASFIMLQTDKMTPDYTDGVR